MASISKGRSSRRKAQAPGKLRIQLKFKDAKSASDDDSNVNDSEGEASVENGIPKDLPEGTIVVQPEAVDDAQAKSKKAPVRIDTSSLDNVACTACGRQLNPYKNGAFQKHPELKVIICKRCEKFLSSGEISKDKDGSDEQCRWCGQGGRLTVCDECGKAFCKGCIMRNFNRSEFNNINDLKHWNCYICDKAPLQSLRENYRNVRDTLKALQERDKAKAARPATGNKTPSTNGTPKSWKTGNNAQGPTSSTKEDEQCSTSGFKSLTAEDLKFDCAGLRVLMDKLSIATNTFREVLDTILSQVGHKVEDGDISQQKENRYAKALSMGLDTYFQSLKTILVTHKKQDSNDKNNTGQGISDDSTHRNSESLGSRKSSKENSNGKSFLNKGQREVQRENESRKSNDKKKAFSKSTSEEKANSEDDVILLSDADEATPKKQKTRQSRLRSPKVSLKEKNKVSLPDRCDENLAAKLELLNEETSQSETDAVNEDENTAARLELLGEQISSNCDIETNEDDDENMAARNDLLKEQTSNCNTDTNNVEENMAAKFDLLSELGEKMVGEDDEEEEDEEVNESSVTHSNTGNEKERTKKDQKIETASAEQETLPKHQQDKDNSSERSEKEGEENKNLDSVEDKNEMSTSDEHIDSSEEENESKTKKARNSKKGKHFNKRKSKRKNADDSGKRKKADAESEGDSDGKSDENVEQDKKTQHLLTDSDAGVEESESEKGKDGSASKRKNIEAEKKKSTKSPSTKKKSTVSETVVSDISSSDLLLSSDDDEPKPVRTRKKKNTKCKDTPAQEKSESPSAKEKQTEMVKEETKEKKPPVATNSQTKKSVSEKRDQSSKEKQPVKKHEVERDESSGNGKKEESKPKVNGKEKNQKDKEEDSVDKEIDKLSKLPTFRKRKAKEMNDGDANGTADNDDDQDEGTENKSRKKYKPGPKSSKVGKKVTDFDHLSSDDEKPDSDNDEEEDENDDLEPSVTFFLGNVENQETNEEETKKSPVEDKESESDHEEEENDKDSSSSNEDSEDTKEKSKKDQADSKKKNEAEKDKDEEDEKSEDENGSEDNEDEKKKKTIHNKLLDANISDSDDSDIGRPKKKKKASEDKSPKKDEDSSCDSSLPSDSLEEEDDSEETSDEENESKKKKKKGKKKGGKKKKRGKGKKDSDEEGDQEGSEEEEDGGKKKGKGKKRKRIKKIQDSSDEKEENEDDDDDDDEKNKSGKRKQIRKVMSNKKLEDSTKAAAKAEEKRRKRIAAKQREFNIETITDENNPMDCPITTKLVLEPGKEEGDPPIVEVNRKLVRKLKPHQVEAVQFMWDCMFESVKRSKKEEGAGCILAHCMGLGKTLSVISFVHTVLSHSEVLNQKTCLVVSPLNTVLNWQNEWRIWFDEEDQLDVWELASCKQNPLRADTLKKWHASGGIMIIGYEMYRNLSQGARCKNKRQKKIFYDTLVNPGPDLVVCDEGHILKNEASSISKAMNQMKTRRRVVLTGTPLQNNLNEYHCMLSFVKPNLLGTRKEFTNRFISPIQNGQCTDSTARDVKLMKARAHVLHEMLAGCVQRRDYSALTKFLPPKQEYVISVRLTETQIELYEKYLQMSGQGVDGVFNNKGARLFSDYQNLMKIWTHPWVLKLAEIRDELKMKYDDEDSFIDDESEGERSFSSSNSSSDEDKVVLSDSGGEGTSLGPHSKKGTRRTRAKARRQAGEDSDPEEVIAEWKSKTRNGESVEEEAVLLEGSKSVTKEWWAAYVTEEDQHKVELSNKLFLLFEILKMCEEIGDKVLIFSQSILSLNIIENFLETIDSKFQQECDALKEEEVKDEKEQFGRSWTKNLDYYRMDGSTSAQNRQLWAANFNDLENYRTRLFLISTKAGGLGINLVAANRVIIFDASWNPSHDVQSIFRVYRFGQTKPCYIYRFLAQGTMEEKIYERQVTKLSLSQRVVDEHQIERHFSANDLRELYNFKPDHWDDGTEKPTLALPKDPLLAEILTNHKHCVLSFHEHDSLLENQVEQTLTEEEKKAAWEEYENEKKGIIVRGPGMERTASWPMMAAAQILSREQITATVHALRQRLPDISEDLFHLHVQQELRRQVQIRQEEMRRMEMMRMQEINISNMIKYQAQQSGLTFEEVRNQMAPWIQMQMQQFQMRAMQSHLMAGTSGMHPSSSMSMMGNVGHLGGASAEHISNNPEDAINLDDN